MRRAVKTITALLILSLIGTGVYLLKKGGEDGPDETPAAAEKIPVTTIRLSPSEFVSRGEYTARLEAVQDVTVIAEAGGKVVEDLVREGDRVEKDQALYRLEDDALRYAVQRAEASLDLSRQSLLKTQDVSRPELLSRLEAVAEERAASLAKAESDAARFDGLYREGAVSLGQKESADLALAAARSRARVADENLGEARTGARREDRAAAEAAVRQAEAALLLARDALEKATINSPLKGIVASKEVFAGDTVGPGRPVAEVVDISSFKVNLGIASADVARFRRGDTVKVVVRPSGVEKDAVIRDVGIKADEKSGSFPVILHMENNDGGETVLRAGMDIVVRFDRARESAVIVAPRSALIPEREGFRAFIVRDGRAIERSLSLGPSSESEAVVTAGLAGGEMLVVVGQLQLRDGDLVELSVEE